MPDDLRKAKYVIDIGPLPSVPVAGSDARFPVARIYCVGRNYAEHAREMGHDPNREPPFFFMKAANSVVQSGSTIGYPVQTKDVHHEIEMVVAIGKGGKNIPVEKALEHVWGYGVGLDMTRRDIQTEAKKMGRPWEMGKSFDESAPVSELSRREILRLLRKREMTAGELAERFDMTKPTMSHHFAVLKEADLVTSRREGQTIWYGLNTTVLEDVVSWAMDLAGARKNGGPR